MIMADQDFDGSHIKGLLINLIHAWWPSLAKIPGFLKEFFTPIVKATRGKQQLSFYTMPEYEAWKRQTENGKGFKIKYYKGLGTSTSKEAKEYFEMLESHRLQYRYDGAQDDRAIDLAFNKKRTDDRKEWINGYVDGELVDHSQPEVSYADFINKELVLFSKANVVRAIPSVVDGFKPSQRKVIFGCFKRKLKNDCKVAQLVGYVSLHGAYHHGEASLSETIVGMAQDFVGSNNLNLLVPQGQFGTRLQGGKDAASARYIYTRLAPVTRYIFKEADDHILEYLNEEGLSIEPTWYCPVIPMVLVNGAEGIGTGWATSVPNYNPRHVIANLRRLLKNQEMYEMLPWFAGFKGSITKNDKEEGKCEVTGIITAHGDAKATITELPVKRWTQDYREFLEENLPKGDRKKDGKALLEDYAEHHTEKTVHFELKLAPEGQRQMDSLEKAFKLRSSISTNNMILFDAEGKIQKYDTPLDIIKDYAALRLKMYEKRKAYMVSRLTRECEVLDARARFIKLVISGELVIKRRKIADLVQELRRRGFKAVHEMMGRGGLDNERPDKEGDDEAEDPDAGDEEDEEPEAPASGEAAATASGSAVPPVAKAVKDFEYLVGMPISSLTAERVAELMRQRELKLQELETLRRKSHQKLWMEDLDELEKQLDERDSATEKAARQEQAKLQKAQAAAKRSTSQGSSKRGAKRSASATAEGGDSRGRGRQKG